MLKLNSFKQLELSDFQTKSSQGGKGSRVFSLRLFVASEYMTEGSKLPICEYGEYILMTLLLYPHT